MEIKVEWRILMRSKEEKSVVAREYWLCQLQIEPNLPQIVHVSIVMYLHKMPLHAKKRASRYSYQP